MSGRKTSTTHNEPRETPSPSHHAKKRQYRAPALTTHGDLKALTKIKGGAMADGGGKPMTRMSGANG